MSIPQKHLNELSTVAVLHKQQIKIVKPVILGVDLRREALLKNLDYMESQVGRLSKMASDANTLAECVREMARNVRVEIASLITE